MLDVRESVQTKDDSVTAVSKGRQTRGRMYRKAGDGEKAGRSKGLKIPRLFTRKGIHPCDEIEWERRHASITDSKKNVIFEQDDVEVPKSWSMLATNVVASKYFYGPLGTPERENSVRQLVHRVTRTISDWGLNDGYFASAEDAETFYSEMSHLCLNQYAAFNSPVWFNVGLYQVYGHSSSSRTSYTWDPEAKKIVPTNNTYKAPQASACFIQSVEDTMEDIMRLAATEAMLFKYGSGTGTDLSTIRSSKERLSGGGTPSGPLSFMRVFDQVAAVIKSGGKTRRAAKMQILRVSHPDIVDFVSCKMREEKKAWALIEEGYDGSMNGEAYDSVMFQNANLSARVNDEFMQAVENDGAWETKSVTTGEVVETHKARNLMRLIAEGTHVCGDPGMQYDSTINRWNTCLNDGLINASNPCSEFMFLDNSACNLASINLMKFVGDTGVFDVEKFKHVVRLCIIAQDILVDNASYPTQDVAANSHKYRPLGLGYANLGAVAMRLGLPYDSDEGRAFAAVLTAVMTGTAFQTSQEMAKSRGPFERYENNRDSMAKVMAMHARAVDGIDSAACPPHLRKAAEQVWAQVAENGSRTGYRNSQVTLLAPTGTIGFMMDCDTTGVEPDIALVKYKQLAGGGQMKLVNRTVRPALKKLGYSDDQCDTVVKHIEAHDTIEGAEHVKGEDMPVFDCAFKAAKGTRSISHRAHLKMMAAVQPFLSGAISKTVNVPNEATVNEIMQLYIDGWKLGLKAVAIYRDGSKRTQPLTTSRVDDGAAAARGVAGPVEPYRRRMPTTRQSITHKFEIVGHEGYLTVGIYDDGSPGEVFITMAKEGSTVGGTMDAFGTAISLCLQYGVPAQELVKKFTHSRFDPAGYTKNPEIPRASSIVDYIFQWLDKTFPNGKTAIGMGAPQGVQRQPAEQASAYAATDGAQPRSAQGGAASAGGLHNQFQHFMSDSPACPKCGAIMVRMGRCHRCFNCSYEGGCG